MDEQGWAQAGGGRRKVESHLEEAVERGKLNVKEEGHGEGRRPLHRPARGSQPWELPSEMASGTRTDGALNKELEESDDDFCRSPLELLQMEVNLPAERRNSYSLRC